MRKFSKVFAVVITLCLIFGVLCTSVFAEEITAKKDLNVSGEGISNVSRIDFEENGAGDQSYASSKTSASGDSTYGWGVVRCSTIQTTVVQSQLGLDGVTTNKYLQHKRLEGGGDVTQSAPYWEYYLGKYSTPTHEVRNYSYVVADYDFACDEYEYTLNGEVCFGSEVPEGATNVHLNYPSTFNHYMIVRASNSAGQADLTTYLQLYVVKNPDNNKHYASANSVYDESDILLSDIAGAWNHISMVIETDKKNHSDSMLRYYCNGQFFAEAKANTKGAEFIQLDSVRFNISAGVVSTGEHYSFCLDNLACNYYALDYESGPDVYGIDDYYADPNHKSNKLNECEDIVYNSSYSYYGTSTPYSAVLEHSDGTFEYSYNIKAALDLIKDGDFVSVTRDVVDYIPSSQDIKVVTFITDGRSRFSLAGEAQEFYKLQNSGNRYTVKLASDDAMKLTWYDSEGEGRQPVKVQKLLPLFVPNDKATELNIIGVVDKTTDPDNPTIELLKKWEWDMNNDGVSDNLDLSALKVSDINEIREAGITELSLVPVFEEAPLLFEMYTVNANGTLEYFVPGNDYSKLTTAQGLSAALSDLEAGSNVYIVLARSFAVDASVTIPSDVTVNFDVNGKSISSDVDNVFTVKGGATLNLYSTVQGGSVASSLAAVTTLKADSCNINIGDYTDEIEKVEISGNNLTIDAAQIVNPDGANNTQTNSEKVYVNINSGTYFASDVAFICATDLVYNINDAKISANTAFASLRNAAAVKVNVDRSVVFSSEFVGNWEEKGCNLAVANSKISGFNHDANVTLGAYNKVQYTSASVIAADGSNVPVAKDVLFGMANNDAVVEEFEIGEDICYFNYNVLTFTEGTEEPIYKDAVIVSWLTPDGEVYKTTTWYPGSVAKKIDLDFENLELNNGWYNLKYNDWVNAVDADTENFVISAEADNKFSPVAKEAVSALDVNISLQVSEVFGYNIYLPALPVNDDTIVFNGFYVGSEQITVGVFENVNVDGALGCFRLAGMIDITDLESDEITIKYTVNGTVLLKKVKIDVLSYVQNVADAYECGSEECKIVFAMMNYKLESYIASTGIENDDITLAISDFLMWHTGDCTCLDFAYENVESTVEYTAIEDKLVGFDYAMLLDTENGYSSKFTFAIRLKSDSGVTAVNAMIDNGDNDIALDFASFAFEDYVEYRAEVELAYLNRVVDLTLTTAEGDLAASYDLAKHIELYDLDFHKSLYVISAEAYAEKE